MTLAQKEGFAEPDPSFDISGQDAAQKTSILATLSFFQNSSMENVYFEGIEKAPLFQKSQTEKETYVHKSKH